MDGICIGYIRINNSNGTYLKDDTTLPVYVDDDFGLYAIEEYEKGEPCNHSLQDLREDGVDFTLVNINN